MRKKKKKISLIVKTIILLIVGLSALCQVFTINQKGDGLLPDKEKLQEADYVYAYCKGLKEYILPDKTRVDCLTETHACEFDWANKWYEGFGQALWYSYNTGKKPCLVLIVKSNKDYVYLKRAKILCEKYGVQLMEVKAKNFKDAD